MCGLAGMWARPLPANALSIVGRMADALAHRGPDDVGTRLDMSAGLALGFRRLAILDLSEAGHQPMRSTSGRFTIVFNGEIYNHRELRQELSAAGAKFAGGSDTEVVLAAIERWGADDVWPRLWGMFGIALWDSRHRRLHLVRDRFGKKPLYVGHAGRTLVFGSELKALAAHPEFSGRVNRQVLTEYFRYGYVPGDRCIYEGITKVPPGTAMMFEGPDAIPETFCYWSAAEEALKGVRARTMFGGVTETEEELHLLLNDAVGRRMIADVPLGAFLSGGIDSSLVTALMVQQSSQRVRTFTISFEANGYDEAAAARGVAQRLCTDHTEFRVTARETLDLVPSLPRIYDEPFADSSQIPTFLVAHLARRHVTVALSGDGGDEVFGGYLRYQWLPSTYQQADRMPRKLRAGIAAGIEAVSPATWDRAMRWGGAVLPRTWRQVRAGEKLHKLAAVVTASSIHDAYRRTVSMWRDPQRVVVGGNEGEPPWNEASLLRDFPHPVDRLMVTDALSYLPGDILVKVDRATMAVGLEARAPFLDHRVYEWAWRQPQQFKLQEGRGKWILRRVLARYVPPALFERPKMGFGVPVGEWLRGPLREWAEALLDPTRLRREGYLVEDAITPVWQAHLRGRGTHEHRLWTVLMFQAWLEERR